MAYKYVHICIHKMYRYLGKTYSIQMHPSRSLVFKTVKGKGRERELCFSKYIRQCSSWSFPTPTLSDPGNIRITVCVGRGEEIYILKNSPRWFLFISLSPSPLPIARYNISRFSQLSSCLWSESSLLYHISSSFHGNAISKLWYSAMPLAFREG